MGIMILNLNISMYHKIFNLLRFFYQNDDIYFEYDYQIKIMLHQFYLINIFNKNIFWPIIQI